MRLVIAIVLLSACGGGGTGGGDDTQVSDASASNDAPAPLHGLLVSWTSAPAVPGPIGNYTTVTSALFHVDRLQVIGDNGQPMSNIPFDLEWKAQGENPATVSFFDAPPGLYSQVNLEIDAAVGTPSYVIRGTVRVSGDTKVFVIEDRGSIRVDVRGFAVTLPPGGDATVPVRLDLKPALDTVDWSRVTEDDGVLELDESSSQIDGFRDKLDDAFKRGS
ncbi:MAG: hypothetical protein H0T46_35470 [Deltaproteobacteria bacterium]|nr:hypothetical protein [Deltaproteobacteria bacterium]